MPVGIETAGVLELEEFGEPFRQGVRRSQLYLLAEVKEKIPWNFRGR